MPHVTRDKILAAVSRSEQGRYSVREITGLMDVPENTAKGHFARNGFRPISTASRGKRIYDRATLKKYALWLYLARESDSPVAYTANQRDELLDKLDLNQLWAAFEESPESFVRRLL